ncbi:hypothetical protein, partial [Endozoicomonas sp. SESOKO1]|uniref:hypothetical protein n=1 Tax=Endozoicomonas sp. SESOKO1 TaxID=2828742 RepID=UPI002147A9AB
GKATQCRYGWRISQGSLKISWNLYFLCFTPLSLTDGNLPTGYLEDRDITEFIPRGGQVFRTLAAYLFHDIHARSLPKITLSGLNDPQALLF